MNKRNVELRSAGTCRQTFCGKLTEEEFIRKMQLRGDGSDPPHTHLKALFNATKASGLCGYQFQYRCYVFVWDDKKEDPF